MKVLITGGSGLIGSALANYLVNKGVEVNILDKRKELQIDRINMLQGSILNKEDVKRAMKGCDYVYHLAAIVGVDLADSRSLECLDVNLIGTRNVLECAVEEKVKKVLFSSSSEVYGEPDQVPINEESILKPKSAYGWSKAVSEEYCKAFKKNSGLSYTIIRYCNIYGLNQALKFVLPLFIDNALSNKPLEIYGSGRQIRSFCYVDDAVIGTELAMMNPNTDGEILNIGNPDEPITMIDLSKKVIQMVANNNGKTVFVPIEQRRLPEREIYNRIPDITKAKKILGFYPKVNLVEGLRKIIEYKKKEKESREIITSALEDSINYF